MPEKGSDSTTAKMATILRVREFMGIDDPHTCILG